MKWVLWGAQHRAAALPSTIQRFVLFLNRQSRSYGSLNFEVHLCPGHQRGKMYPDAAATPAVAYHTCMGANIALESPPPSVKRILEAPNFT